VDALGKLVQERSRTYFANDTGSKPAQEPGRVDFLSPSLVEADLMLRVVPPAEFQTWLRRFLPDVGRRELTNWFEPVRKIVRGVPQSVHLDGLNLSRAWCMCKIAAALPEKDPARQALFESAALHAKTALPDVASGDFMGEYWLPSFAVYLTTKVLVDSPPIARPLDRGHRE
jgi:hypothetical protein